MEALDMQEKTTLDCRQIHVQIVKAQTLINDVDRKSEFSAADVLAFLIDFRIGNAMERNAAIQSADDRITRLKELRDREGCEPPLQSVNRDS